MNYSVTGEQLTSIADAIRTKTGGTAELEFPTEFVSVIENIQTPKKRGNVTATFSFSDTYNRFIQGNSYLQEEASCNIPTDLLYTSDNKSILQPTAIILNNIPSDIQTKIMQTYADSPIRVTNGVIYVAVKLWNRTADMIEIPSNASIMVSLSYCKK